MQSPSCPEVSRSCPQVPPYNGAHISLVRRCLVCPPVSLTSSEQPFRCLEQAGTTSFLKPKLLSVAKGVVQVVEQSGLVGSSLVFRMPQQDAAAGGLGQPSDGWLDWEPLRAQLPELAGDTIIIAWLRARGSLIGDTGRVLYRGMERVLDLGALGWLSGIPCGENGGTLHLRLK